MSASNFLTTHLNSMKCVNKIVSTIDYKSHIFNHPKAYIKAMEVRTNIIAFLQEFISQTFF